MRSAGRNRLVDSGNMINIYHSVVKTLEAYKEGKSNVMPESF